MIAAGSTLVASDAPGCTCIWSIGDSPGRAHRLKTQRSACVGLDSDGERAVSPGTGGMVRLLDVESGQLIVQLGEATTAMLKMGILKGGE